MRRIRAKLPGAPPFPPSTDRRHRKSVAGDDRASHFCGLTMAQPSSGIRLGCQRNTTVTLLHPDNKLGRDIAIMRAEVKELHAKLARTPAVIARTALGIIFSTAVVTTLFNWWLIAH
jgi:hypothetical protein